MLIGVNTHLFLRAKKLLKRASSISRLPPWPAAGSSRLTVSALGLADHSACTRDRRPFLSNAERGGVHRRLGDPRCVPLSPRDTRPSR